MKVSGQKPFRKVSGIDGVVMTGFESSLLIEGELRQDRSESSDKSDRKYKGSGDQWSRKASGFDDARTVV